VVIIILAGVAALIGSRLSKSHTATRSIFLRQSPQNVYDVIRDFSSAPAWRSDVKRVEVQTQPDGKVRLREEGKNGAVNYELAEDVPGKRMATRILDTDLGYSGKWTFVFAPVFHSPQRKARVRIDENIRSGDQANTVVEVIRQFRRERKIGKQVLIGLRKIAEAPAVP